MVPVKGHRYLLCFSNSGRYNTGRYTGNASDARYEIDCGHKIFVQESSIIAEIFDPKYHTEK